MIEVFKISRIINFIISILFINGIVFILDNKLGLFNTLHSSMLQNIESSYIAKQPNYNSENKSIVILISNHLFEKEFNSQTPINKNVLNNILQNIIDQKPKKIIFDLDISPDYNFNIRTQSIDHNLYSTITNNAKNIEFVLPFYFLSSTQENNQLKKQWVSYMCKNNIIFGFPFIHSEIGSVLQYYDNPHHVSLISKNKQSDICKEIIDENINLSEIIKKYSNKNVQYDQLPINYQQINTSTIVLNDLNDLKKYDLSNKTIFLGGGYGFDDKYITPYGEKFGVEVLNSIHYSLSYELDKNNAILTLVIFDILIGILFGITLELILKQRTKTHSENVFLLCNFLLIFALFVFYFISLSISAYLFHNMYLWINPVPILIGLFIDSILGIGTANKQYEKEKISIKNLLKIFFVFLGIYGLINSF